MDPNQHHRPEKLNETEKTVLLGEKLHPGSENSPPPSHTDTHLLYIQPQTRPQPAQQQFPWLVNHIQRAGAEIWSPDVKDCLGHVVEEWAKHTQTSKYTLTEAHNSKYTQYTHR